MVTDLQSGNEDFDWNFTPERAIELQNELRSQVREAGLDLARIRLVGGVDASYGRDQVFAAAVVWDAERGEIVASGTAARPLTFPYLPGLLAFRELPVIRQALARLNRSPDVLIVDGHGRAHPRRFGLACHLGLLCGLPTFGCAKALLVGSHPPLPEPAGSWAPVSDGDEIIAVAVRTRTGVKPLIVSIGHLIDLESAVRLTLQYANVYRLPEPLRQAHLLAGKVRNNQGVV